MTVTLQEFRSEVLDEIRRIARWTLNTPNSRHKFTEFTRISFFVGESTDECVLRWIRVRRDRND